jgi:hypothetical protein
MAFVLWWLVLCCGPLECTYGWEWINVQNVHSSKLSGHCLTNPFSHSPSSLANFNGSFCGSLISSLIHSIPFVYLSLACIPPCWFNVSMHFKRSLGSIRHIWGGNKFMSIFCPRFLTNFWSCRKF